MTGHGWGAYQPRLTPPTVAAVEVTARSARAITATVGGVLGVLPSHDDDGRYREVYAIAVPNPVGREHLYTRAIEGDWVVQTSNGEYEVVPADEFATRYRPA